MSDPGDISHHVKIPTRALILNMKLQFTFRLLDQLGPFGEQFFPPAKQADLQLRGTGDVRRKFVVELDHAVPRVEQPRKP